MCYQQFSWFWWFIQLRYQMLWECIVCGPWLKSWWHKTLDRIRSDYIQFIHKPRSSIWLMFCTYRFTSKCQVLFFLNCKVVNNTLKTLQMCCSWGMYMHISCGCVLLTFHMCGKHGFTTKLELLKADLAFERLPLSSCLQSSFLLEYQKFDHDDPPDWLGSVVCLLDTSSGL